MLSIKGYTKSKTIFIFGKQINNFKTIIIIVEKYINNKQLVCTMKRWKLNWYAQFTYLILSSFFFFNRKYIRLELPWDIASGGGSSSFIIYFTKRLSSWMRRRWDNPPPTISHNYFVFFYNYTPLGRRKGRRQDNPLPTIPSHK